MVEMAGPDGFPEQSCLTDVLTFFASRGLKKPKMLFLVQNLDFRDLPGVILA